MNGRHGGDVDGDGDLDLLAVKFNQNEQSIHWFENTDGLGTYQEAGLITSNVNSTMDIVTADLDGDQDADVISASYWDDRWPRNNCFRAWTVPR